MSKSGSTWNNNWWSRNFILLILCSIIFCERTRQGGLHDIYTNIDIFLKQFVLVWPGTVPLNLLNQIKLVLLALGKSFMTVKLIGSICLNRHQQRTFVCGLVWCQHILSFAIPHCAIPPLQPPPVTVDGTHPERGQTYSPLIWFAIDTSLQR